MRVIHFFGKTVRLIFWLVKLWIWVIPSRLTIIAIAGYFLLMLLLFGTVHVSEIKAMLSETAYLFGFVMPFALPMFIAFISAFGLSKQASGRNSLEQAIKYRDGQMGVKPDVEASKILRKTAYLDMLNSHESEVFLSARRGFDAQYSTKSPTEVFKDLMNDD